MKYDETTTPAICEECLGSNKHVSLRRVVQGAQCKICTRPYTLFKWNSQKFTNERAQFKKTIICLTCARSRNCCQCCMRDLLMGVDEKARDELISKAGLGDILKTRDDVDIVHNAKTLVGRLYNANALEKRFANEEVKELLQEERQVLIQRLTKFIQEQEQEEKDNSVVLLKRAFKPLPRDALVKLMKRFPLNSTLEKPPANEEITTLFLFGITESTFIYSIQDYFLEILGELRESNAIDAIALSAEGRFGYVKFSSRAIAERASEIIFENQKQDNKDPNLPCLINLNNIPIRVCWLHKVEPSLPSSFTNVQLFNIGNIIGKHMKKLDKDATTNVQIK